MAIALVSNTGKKLGVNGGTTSAIDTTGANFLAAEISDYSASSPDNITDSKGNTWTQRTAYTGANLSRVRIFYCTNPTVGSSHTFTYGTSSSYSSICVAAFSGADTSSPYDVENGNNSNSASPGSITPTQDNELVITAFTYNNTSTLTIDSGFTITDQNTVAGGSSYGGALAYKVQTTAAAVNPAWSEASNGVSIASFKAGVAGRTTHNTRSHPLGYRSGVGFSVGGRR